MTDAALINRNEALGCAWQGVDYSTVPCAAPLCQFVIFIPKAVHTKIRTGLAVFYCPAGHEQRFTWEEYTPEQIAAAETAGFNRGYDEGKWEAQIEMSSVDTLLDKIKGAAEAETWDLIAATVRRAVELTEWVDSQHLRIVPGDTAPAALPAPETDTSDVDDTDMTVAEFDQKLAEGIPVEVVTTPAPDDAGDDDETPDVTFRFVCRHPGCNDRFQSKGQSATHEHDAHGMTAWQTTSTAPTAAPSHSCECGWGPGSFADYLEHRNAGHLPADTPDSPLPAGIQPQAFPCPECSAAFHSKSALAGHSGRHRAAERTYICDCGFQAANATGLAAHQRRCPTKGLDRIELTNLTLTRTTPSKETHANP